jgi:hypothetical protein
VGGSLCRGRGAGLLRGGEGQLDFLWREYRLGELKGSGVGGAWLGISGCGFGFAGERRDRWHERWRGVRGCGERGKEAGCGTAPDERVADAVADEVMHGALLAEADFGLGRMDVDVDLVRGHLEEDEDNGKRCGRDDVAIGFADRVQDEAVADEALVDEDVDGVAIELLQFGLGDEAAHAQRSGIGRGVVFIALPRRRLGQSGAVEGSLGCHGDELVEGVAAEDLVDALGGLRDRRRDEQGVGRGVQLEMLLGMGERVMCNQCCYMRELGGFGLEEFAAGRSVEEEIADRDGGSGGKAGVFDAIDFSADDFDAGPAVFACGAGFELDAGDGGDGRKRFAAEAEGGDGEQVVAGADLGGSVALEGQQGVVADHADAVVGDADELAASGFDFDADTGSAGVEGVFEQLFHHGRGAVDDLAGGDLIGYLVREDADAAGCAQWICPRKSEAADGRLGWVLMLC